MEFMGMFVNCVGTRPSAEKKYSMIQLSKPTAIGDVRLLLGTSGHPRMFLPN